MFLRMSCISLLVFTSFGWTGAQERTVIVKNTDRELVRTAFRLGVSVRQVEVGRRLLREATELAPEVAEKQHIGRLAYVWLTLDRTHAEDHLARLIEALRTKAEEVTNPARLGMISRSAFSISATLGQINAEKAESLILDWPEETATPEAAAKTNSQALKPAEERRQFDRSRFGQRMREDLDGALRELRKVEEGQLDLRLRTSAIQMLLRRDRLEDANLLLDETLERLGDLPANDSNLSAVSNLFGSYVREGDPERTEGLIGAWAAMFRSMPQDAAPRYPVGELMLTDSERNVITVLGNLQQAPETALKALEQFPELREKVQSAGGLDVLLRTRYRRSRPSDQDAEAARLDRLIQNRLMSSQTPLADPDQGARDLEALVIQIRNLNDPNREATYLLSLFRTYFLLQGELSPDLRATGLDYVSYFRRPDGSETAEPLKRQRKSYIDQLEAMIYGMWLWSDPAEARVAVADLPVEQRYRSVGSYLGNLGAVQRRYWNNW